MNEKQKPDQSLWSWKLALAIGGSQRAKSKLEALFKTCAERKTEAGWQESDEAKALVVEMSKALGALLDAEEAEAEAIAAGEAEKAAAVALKGSAWVAAVDALQLATLECVSVEGSLRSHPERTAEENAAIEAADEAMMAAWMAVVEAEEAKAVAKAEKEAR